MELQQLRTTGDTVLLHVPERQQTTLQLDGRALTVDGQPLYFDPSWREMETKQLAGLVVACPERVGESYLLSRGSTSVRVSAIAERLQVGDMVYTTWTVSEAHGEVVVPDYLPEVGKVYRATLNQVVARVREGRLEPFGSYVLCKPVWPADVQEVEVPGFPGKVRLRVSASGLTMGTEEVPPLPWQGEVVHVGEPLRGQPRRVRPGDRVVFDKRMCGADKRPMKLQLGAEEFLCIRQDYIAAVLEEVEEPLRFSAAAYLWSLRSYKAITDVADKGVPVFGPGIRQMASQQENRFSFPGPPLTEADVVRSRMSHRIDGDGELPAEMVADNERYRRDRALVTTCCGADHFHARADDGTAVFDFCTACNQVAHLVPANEFSRNKPAA